MKLPLYVHFDSYGCDWVYDASGQLVAKLVSKHRKFTLALVRKMNSHWRWRWFGHQPYAAYTREDWLFERNTGKP